MSHQPVVNISAYKFVSLDALPSLRQHVEDICRCHSLLGTVLIATEGINLFLAGARAGIDAIVAGLRADARFADLEAKEALSTSMPFRRLRVKLKAEIITMKRPAIRPQLQRAPAISPATLKRWLDQGHDDIGRALVMLDTRNAFEANYGRFERCVDFRIAKFSDFPAAVEAGSDGLHGKTVVTYCTGGIRCEKAAIVMREAGIDNVYQLDGGILKYFEEIGGAHWQGRCFVFDEREALEPPLMPGAAPDPGREWA
jgi:UPF0176 protein